MNETTGAGRDAAHTPVQGHEHTHDRWCGHATLPHDDHDDFLHDGQVHHLCSDHVEKMSVSADTVHLSPRLDGSALGAASMRDFRLICDVVSDLGAAGDSPVGGVWLNIGSAVVLPEVLLKAVSVARNLGADLDRMTTANFDMTRHYRPHVNVVTRPVTRGRGYEVIGHHEILLPLLRQAVIESLAAAG